MAANQRPTSSATDYEIFMGDDATTETMVGRCPSGIDHADTEIDDQLDDSSKRVGINIKDSQDGAGTGMNFTLNFLSTFKKIFDTYKASSCKACKAASGIRFKNEAVRIQDDDTPKTLMMRHNHTLSIRAYSNPVPIPCSTCKNRSYPSTNGEILDGDVSLLFLDQPHHRTKIIRLFFQCSDSAIWEIAATNIYSMRHPIALFAEVADRDVSGLRFFFDGERISEKDTPDEMGMVNGSIIDVFGEQWGG